MRPFVPGKAAAGAGEHKQGSHSRRGGEPGQVVSRFASRRSQHVLFSLWSWAVETRSTSARAVESVSASLPRRSACAYAANRPLPGPVHRASPLTLAGATTVSVASASNSAWLSRSDCGGLEHRYGPNRSTRVGIPPPPLRVTKSRRSAVSRSRSRPIRGDASSARRGLISWISPCAGTPGDRKSIARPAPSSARWSRPASRSGCRGGERTRPPDRGTPWPSSPARRIALAVGEAGGVVQRRRARLPAGRPESVAGDASSLAAVAGDPVPGT